MSLFVRYVCTFQRGAASKEVIADHVVLAMPFTTLRQVDLSGVKDTISPLHLRAIDEEPLGTNSKFFLQCKSRASGITPTTPQATPTAAP